MEEHHITVPRTARYHTLGDARTAQAIWIVLHGYGQLARYFLRNFEGLANDVLIAAPEGLSRYYTDAEHVRVGATWMTREDRGAEITDQHMYLDMHAEHLLNHVGRAVPIRCWAFRRAWPLRRDGLPLGAHPSRIWSFGPEACRRTSVHQSCACAGAPFR